MANLSEQLRATADLIRAWDKYELSGPVPAKLDYALAANQMSEAASALDRLTVDGLAGVIARQLAITPAAIDRIANGHGKTIATALLSYITGETHD